MSDSDGASDAAEEPSGKCQRVSSNCDQKTRKEKHKAVEQKRREKTKELVVELQELLPNLNGSNSPNCTMNTVLQSAIDFLAQSQMQGAFPGNVSGAGAADGAMFAPGVSRGEVERAYMSGFMIAPTGIAYASADGSIQSVNPAFAAMLGYTSDNRSCLVGRTFFSLVAPQDMQNTLKAVSHLLSGEMRHVALSQNCLRKDGTSAAFSVEMHCLRNANTVRGIVCFMCPADRDDGPGTNAAPSHQAAHQAMAAMAAGGIPGVPDLAATLGYGWGLALGGNAPQASSSSSTISLTQAGLALSAMGSQNRL